MKDVASPPPAEDNPADEVIDEDDFSQSGDLTGDKGVWKEIIKKGSGWQRPENGDEVTMHYKGTLLDGVMFDSSIQRNAPFNFKLGDGKVIKGWDIVAKTMAKGEKAKVTLRPEYAYGRQGSPPKIPSNATLIFEMELLSWHSKRDVYGDGTVVKTEINTGDGWERPGKLAEVTCQVATYAYDTEKETRGAELNSDENKTFTLGVGQVPEVWDKIVLDMKRGSKVQLICKDPHIGGTGIDFDIPKDTKAIEYEIQLKSWLKVEDLEKDGSLMKKVLGEGDGWERPKEGSSVVLDVEYYIYNPTSKKCTDTPYFSDEKFKFVCGDGDIIDGLDTAIQSMKQRETALVTLQPKHAYATAKNLLTAACVKEGVTADSWIQIKVEVIEFEKAKDMWSMSFDEKADEMEMRKKKGNELIKVGRNHLAKRSYERAVAFFDSPTSELDVELKRRVNQLLVQCHLNLAVVSNKLGEKTGIIEHCNKALELEPSNIKALYRRGTAYLDMDDFYSAEADFNYAISIDADGNSQAEFKRKLVQLKKRRTEQDKKDRKLYSNMFSRLSKMEEKEAGTTTPMKTDQEEEKEEEIKVEVEGQVPMEA